MPKRPGIDVRPDHWEIVRSVLEKHVPQYAVWAFGSRAKWTAKDYSDLDLAVITEKPLPLGVSSGLSEDFSESDLPWKVDVVDWATTSDSFRKIITEDHVVIQAAASVKHRAASSDLPTVRLDSVAQINPRRKVSKGNSVPFIDMAALPQNSRDINYSDVVLREAKGAGAHFQNRDTLLARITPCLENGKTAQVRQLKSGEVGEGSTEFITLCGIDPADNDFVYYLCRDPVFREYAIGRMEGTSGRQRVSWQSIAAYEFICPKPIERRAAALILSALDERITLLRETNATLEAIAKALFKSWFVDFDPARAKMEGRAPEDMDEAAAALFPDGFEESALGLVPKGWRVGALGDIAQTVRKQLQPAELHAELHHVGLEHIPRQSLSLSSWGTADGLESAKAAFSEGDILFGKLRPYFHKVVVAPFDGVCSTDVLVCQGACPEYYGVAAMHLFSTALIDYADRLSNGAKMPRVNWKDLAAYPIVIPPKRIAAEYAQAIEPMLARMKSNVHEAQTLATLRDTLLPRLISGALRLDEAKSDNTNKP